MIIKTGVCFAGPYEVQYFQYPMGNGQHRGRVIMMVGQDGEIVMDEFVHSIEDANALAERTLEKAVNLWKGEDL